MAQVAPTNGRELIHQHTTGELVVEPCARKNFRRCSTTRFSFVQSTEAHHKAEEGDYNFYGPYAHIRKKLDYSYHTHYRKERQWLQDSIVEDFLEGTKQFEHPEEPWFIYTVGAPGAGKRHTINTLVGSGKLPLMSFVHVEPHEIRRRLPEYSSYIHHSPDRVDKLTAKESGLIMELLVRVGLQAGCNVVLDGSLGDSEWYSSFYKGLKSDYPNLRMALLNVTAPREQILHRAAEVAMWTHRQMDVDKIDNILAQIPVSIKRLKPEVDYYCELHNGRDEITCAVSWEKFTKTFLQTSSELKKLEQKCRTEEQIRDAFKIMIGKLWKKSLFAPGLSSEQNYKASKDERGFFGAFSHIRSTLDYRYHEHYTQKRQRMQDKIISDMLNAAVVTDKDGNVCTTPTEPWLVFTAGAMGAGKSYTMNKLVENGRFPLLAFVLVDPDEIRRHLPEFHIYVDENPELAGELTRKESGFIAEILTLAAIQAGKNVLVDGSLRDADWYKLYFARLKEEYPNVRQAIIHVTAPRDAIFQRAASRAMTTGRVVPQDVLEAALEQVPRSVKILAPLVDYFAEINNAPGAPDVELNNDDWESFEARWVQTCAWVPSRRKFLKTSQTLNEHLALNGRKER